MFSGTHGKEKKHSKKLLFKNKKMRAYESLDNQFVLSSLMNDDFCV